MYFIIFQRPGRHIIMITFANVEIPRSPFEVNIGKHQTSKIKAYGPGLKGGIINKPAKFTVDTCGETGALGFSIQGPSQAKINCKVGPILYHFVSFFLLCIPRYFTTYLEASFFSIVLLLLFLTSII